nr:hypothetical protein CFP56_09378 [Quercus suber]
MYQQLKATVGKSGAQWMHEMQGSPQLESNGKPASSVLDSCLGTYMTLDNLRLLAHISFDLAEQKTHISPGFSVAASKRGRSCVLQNWKTLEECCKALTA